MAEIEAEPESVSFPSLCGAPLRIPAVQRVPEIAGGRAPAGVIARGSSGPNSRGASHARVSNAGGIATLEIDMLAPRGLKGGLDRPKSIPDTPRDAFGAVEFLSSDARIDPPRIGVMGFSRGGVLSMPSATKPFSEC